jgi:hypothetical protein
MRVCDKFFIYETNNLEYLYITFFWFLKIILLNKWIWSKV